jgi:hypothetical protein
VFRMEDTAQRAQENFVAYPNALFGSRFLIQPAMGAVFEDP